MISYELANPEPRIIRAIITVRDDGWVNLDYLSVYGSTHEIRKSVSAAKRALSREDGKRNRWQKIPLTHPTKG